MTPESLVRLFTGGVVVISVVFPELLVKSISWGLLTWLIGLYLILSGATEIRLLNFVLSKMKMMRSDGHIDWPPQLTFKIFNDLQEIDISCISRMFPAAPEHNHEVIDVPQEQEMMATLTEETPASLSDDGILDATEQSIPGVSPSTWGDYFTHDVHAGMHKKKVS